MFSNKIHIDKYIGKEYNVYSKISRVTGRYKGDFSMTKQEVKRKVCAAIDANKDKLYDIGMSIFSHPELGYKEYRTADIVKAEFDALGLKHQDNLALTGVKAKLFENAEGPNVCIMGELDAVVCPDHPYADPVTGAAHCCGHYGQITALIAAAIGLDAVKDEIKTGNVTFFAVPAEENVELEYRKGLMDEGKIKYVSGKQNLVHEGYFDDIDMSMMVHANNDHNVITASSRSVGFVSKTVKFIGKEAHAGAAPWDGVNALDAAALALQAINAVRSTLKDQDVIRIHPVITKGGTLVNIVPNDVRMEMYVRGATVEAIKDANFKVNRAIKGAAYAVGCEVEINDMAGDLPCNYEQTLAHLYGDNGAELFPDRPVVYDETIGGGSSDMGDIATIMPAIQPGTGGIVGAFHSKDFVMEYPDEIFLDPAKIMACTVIDLLWDGAAKAKEVLANFNSPYNAKNFDGIWDEIMAQ